MTPVDLIEVVDALRLINEFSDHARQEAAEQDNPYRDLPGGASLKLADAIEAANMIHAAIAGQDTIDTLNSLAGQCSLTMRLDHSGSLQWCHDDMRPVLAHLLVPVLDFVDRLGPQRVGICQAQMCVDIFADRSPAGARRFCCQRCATRTRVGTWRERQR